MTDIPVMQPGHHITADEMNRRREVMMRRSQSGNCFIDSTGEYSWGGAVTETDDQWVRLTSNLAAKETSGATATGHLGTWNGSSYDEGSDSVTVQDLSGGHWGIKGEWIRVQSRTVSGNTIYEALSRGSDKHIVTLSGDLTNSVTAAATCTIGGVVATVYVVHGNFVADGDTITSGTEIAVFYDLANGWVADNARCG